MIVPSNPRPRTAAGGASFQYDITASPTNRAVTEFTWIGSSASRLPGQRVYTVTAPVATLQKESTFIPGAKLGDLVGVTVVEQITGITMDCSDFVV